MKRYLKTWIGYGQALFTEEIMKRDQRDTVTTITQAFQIDCDSTLYLQDFCKPGGVGHHLGQEGFANFVYLTCCLFYQCSRDVNNQFSLTYIIKRRHRKVF
jgi:hypothetical protein